ncbi:MAG TPA: cysteine--tRNA ligase, partial [Thermopetrobacter sp.]|nr:cysteine--tRNA ligase [Thermopetrobacter sp.]
KMSKSLGNFVTIHELLEEWPGEALRLNMLRTHYRAPIDWTRKGLEESRRVLDKWYRAVGDVAPAAAPDEAVVAALCDDLNTPKAIAELHRLQREGRAAELKASAALLGLLPMSGAQWEEATRTAAAGDIDAAEVERLIAERSAARARRDWATADRIRDELAGRGIVLKDGPEGTTWEVRRD